MNSPEVIKQRVAATLDRLNMHGTIASISDALIAVRRVQEKKIIEAFNGLFSDFGLEDLEAARQVLSDMFPKKVEPTYAISHTKVIDGEIVAFNGSVTPAPASVAVTQPQQKNKKGGGKKR